MFTLELLRLAELSHPVETVERVQPDLAVQRHVVASHQPGMVQTTDTHSFVFIFNGYHETISGFLCQHFICLLRLLLNVAL